jgi:hypothetical protein
MGIEPMSEVREDRYQPGTAVDPEDVSDELLVGCGDAEQLGPPKTPRAVQASGQVFQ